jgi:hypothetical protein
MIYVEAPNVIESDKKSIFLAGGITGCSEWQKELANNIAELDIVVYNPRRKNFPMDDPTAAQAQITWEFVHLKKASMISFWFGSETIQPIVLFEYGKWIVSNKPIAVGVDPKYQRKQDVEIQTTLERPGLKIVYSLKDLTDQIYTTINEIQFV